MTTKIVVENGSDVYIWVYDEEYKLFTYFFFLFKYFILFYLRKKIKTKQKILIIRLELTILLHTSLRL